MFNSDGAKIDTSVFNPARIFRLYYTWARKGENSDERPHRRSCVKSIPDNIEVVPKELLEQIAVMAPPASRASGGTSITREPHVREAQNIDPSDLDRRITAYLDKVAGAIEGQGGDKHTFTVACRLIHGFDLTVEQALPFIREWNKRCVPPWPEDKLEYKLQKADELTETSRGYLLDEEAADDPHRLARRFIRSYRRNGKTTLRHWKSDWYQWKGGAYRLIDKDVVEAMLNKHIKAEFDTHYHHVALPAWQQEADAGEKKGKPKPLKVTGNVVKNAYYALISECILAEAKAPLWLDGTSGADPMELISTPNGLLHIPLGAAKPTLLPSTPDFFTTVALDYDVDLNAPKPTEWLTFLDELWHDDEESKEALQEWFGYCLLPDTRQQKMVFVAGPPRSGKGTICRVLTSLIGSDNVAGPTLSTFAERFGLYELKDKYLAIVSDARLSGKTDQARTVERLLSISGEDSMSVEKKNGPTYTMKLPTRLMILSNEVPRLTDASTALPSRMIFLQLFESWLGKEDKTLTERLLSERAGILIWSLEGLRRLRERGHFVQPGSGEKQLRILREICSPITSFVEEHCRLDPNHNVLKSTLFEKWRKYAQEHNLPDKSDAMFARDLYAAYPSIDEKRLGSTGERPRCFTGIRLKNTDNQTSMPVVTAATYSRMNARLRADLRHESVAKPIGDDEDLDVTSRMSTVEALSSPNYSVLTSV